MRFYIYLALLLLFVGAVFVYKIPIVCYGCESPEGLSKYIFKCVNDTSENSSNCKISQDIDKVYKDTNDKMKIVSRAVFNEFTSEIPGKVRQLLSDLLEKITTLARDIITNLKNFASSFGQYVKDAFSKISDVVLKTAKEFYNVVIKPITDFINKFVVQPIIQLIALLVSFKEVVKNAVVGAIKTVTGVLADFGNFIILPITKIPEGIEFLINMIIRGLNELAKGAVKAINVSVESMVKGIEIVTNGIIKVINDSVNGLTGVIEKGVNTVTLPIVEGINGVLGAWNGIRDLSVLGVRPLGWLPGIGTINYNGIDIPDISIKDIDIQEPKISDPNPIPEVSFKAIGETIKEGMNKAFDFATSGIKEAYNFAMKPINETIQRLSAIVASLYIAMKEFTNTYLSKEFMMKVFNKIKDGVFFTVSEGIRILKENVFTPIYNLLMKLIDKIKEGIYFIISKLKTVFLIILERVKQLFSQVSDVLYNASKFVLTNMMNIGFYGFAVLINNLIPLPVSRTVKLNMVFIIILYGIYMTLMFYVGSMARDIFLVALILIVLASMVFLMPDKSGKKSVQKTATKVPVQVSADQEQQEEIYDESQNQSDAELSPVEDDLYEESAEDEENIEEDIEFFNDVEPVSYDLNSYSTVKTPYNYSNYYAPIPTY